MLFVIIGGASGSGKSEIGQALYQKLKEARVPTTVIKMDDYYKTRDPDAEPDLQAYFDKTDFDSPDSLQLDLLIEHLNSLETGANISRPQYSFVFFTSDTSVPIQPYAQVVIIEGMFCLDLMPKLEQHDPIGVYVGATEYETILNRRIARDITGCRGVRSEAMIRALDATKIRPSFKKYIEHCKRLATHRIMNDGEGDIDDHVQVLSRVILSRLKATSACQMGLQ